MKPRRDLYLCITCLLLALLITASNMRTRDEALASRIAPRILRFHVLANSDSDTDQQLKLAVRTLLLDTIYEDLGENASLEETKAYVLTHKDRLEALAESCMNSQGVSYPAHLTVVSTYFPTKTYGDFTFPCGTYEAVEVTIGAGKGHNWWCVLYPPLCFTDSTYAVVPDASSEVLRASLTPADYRALLKNGAIKIRPRLKIADYINLIP